MEDITPPSGATRRGMMLDETCLQESYRCCEQAKIPRELTQVRHVLAGRHLKDLLGRHAALVKYSRLLFSDTYQCLADRRHVFVLTDDRARVVDLYSEPQLLEGFVRSTGICPGASLGEDSCGTNAVPLALSGRDGAIVAGDQHFCRLFHPWNSLAVPVLGANGKPQACMGVWLPHAAPVGESLALAKLMARDLQSFVSANKPELPGDEGLPGRGTGLTERQRHVLRLFAKGLSYKEIAEQLGINSVKTVEEHLDAVRVKLSASSRRECIQKAMDLGIL